MQIEQITNPSEVPGAAKVLNFLADVGLRDSLILGQDSLDALAEEKSRGGRVQVVTITPKEGTELAALLRHPKTSPFREFTVSPGNVTVSWNNLSLSIDFAEPGIFKPEAAIAQHGAALKLDEKGRDVVLACTPEYAAAREQRMPYRYW
jgi:hypothetical protein